MHISLFLPNSCYFSLPRLFQCKAVIVNMILRLTSPFLLLPQGNHLSSYARPGQERNEKQANNSGGLFQLQPLNEPEHMALGG